jgi:vacuolar-type H+-ATPase subunit C/Vma6
VRPPLGDAAARARGLAGHLLSRQALERLARASGSGVLAGLLQGFGYWPATTDGGAEPSAVQAVDAAIEHEGRRRLGLLGRWLAERRAHFIGVFEEEERRAIRIRLRGLASGDKRAPSGRAADSGAGLSRRAREELGRAADVTGLVNALGRIDSSYAEPLERSLRTEGENLLALELALDRAFAQRALQGARRLGGCLLAWVEDGIDLENAWCAIVREAQGFVEGGRRLSRERYTKIASLDEEVDRRRQLADAFASGPLSRVFDDVEIPLSALEARAARARISAARHASRLDPIGAAPILEVVMRMRAEWVDLRRINWGISQGVPTDLIVGQLMVTR